MEFDWDAGNISHIALHSVTREEAEQVIENEPFEIGTLERNGELRTVQLGETDAGRVLLVATTDRTHLVRVVTAYAANRKFRRFYAERKASFESDVEDSRLPK